MVISVLVTFFNLFVIVVNFLILLRVVSSWIVAEPLSNPITHLIYSLTEPVLAPVRRLLPKSSAIDFAPLATFFLLQLLLALVNRLTLGL